MFFLQNKQKQNKNFKALTQAQTQLQSLLQKNNQLTMKNNQLTIKNNQLTFENQQLKLQLKLQLQQVLTVPTVLKKALLIGINYKNTSNELQGCINDVTNMKAHLIEKHGFNAEDIVMLCDNTPLQPTKANILREFQALLTSNAELLFFHYSGHGGQIKDVNNDEKDGTDETIFLVDMTEIVDDQLNELINKYLSEKATLFALFDSCHSGSVLDLKYCFNNNENNNTLVANDNTQEQKSKGQVIMISGCADSQTSADAYISSTQTFQGAMTYAYLNSYVKNTTCVDLVTNMNTLLQKEQYEQTPQLSFKKIENDWQHKIWCNK